QFYKYSAPKGAFSNHRILLNPISLPRSFLSPLPPAGGEGSGEAFFFNPSPKGRQQRISRVLIISLLFAFSNQLIFKFPNRPVVSIMGLLPPPSSVSQ
ncbi:MAG: hypothetical protein Q8K69_15745, partial [Bacteroidota bacterium]|nr:hypothetical protein [Bacteroidota bacterium]